MSKPNPTVPIEFTYTKTKAYELVLLALCSWREARSDGYAGMHAVAWSVRNRVLKPNWWGKDWISVILHKFAYSSFNIDDPNAAKLPADYMKDPSWADALKAAEEVYNGMTADPTLGATHYHLTKMNPPPAWATAPSTTFLIEIGSHRFYKAN